MAASASETNADICESTEKKFTFFWKSGSPFSQWHPSKFTVDGVPFGCAEQYMMYQKAGRVLTMLTVIYLIKAILFYIY